MHVSLGRVDVLLCGGNPVIAIVTHIFVGHRNEHTIHLKEFTQIFACGITHLLGHMQIIVLAIRLVSTHRVAFSVHQRSIIVVAALLDGILTKHLEECGIEVGVMSLCMIVEIELVIHARLLPDVHVQPSYFVGK